MADILIREPSTSQFSVGTTYLLDLTRWRVPIRPISELPSRPIVVTAVDHEAGKITMDSVK